MGDAALTEPRCAVARITRSPRRPRVGGGRSRPVNSSRDRAPGGTAVTRSTRPQVLQAASVTGSGRARRRRWTPYLQHRGASASRRPEVVSRRPADYPAPHHDRHQERSDAMKLGLSIGYSGAELNLPVDKVLLAERLGFDSVWTAEAYGSDAITPLAYLAALT